MPLTFFEELRNKIRAGYPLVYIAAREDWRAVQEVTRIAESDGLSHGEWTITNGWNIRPGKGEASLPAQKLAELRSSVDPDSVVRRDLTKTLGSGVWVLVNFHRFMDEPPMIQAFKDLVQIGKAQNKTVVLVSNVQKIPAELNDDFSISEFRLPDRDLIASRIAYIVEAMAGRVPMPEGAVLDRVTEAGLGMTTWEMENALSLSLIESGMFDPMIISREKAKAVNKDGVLEYFEKPPSNGLDEVGGLDNAKQWLRQRRRAFGKEARAYGLPQPKGILICGVPGTGKSLFAKAVSSELELPMVRIDFGRLFGSLIGESERKMRGALAMLESIAPCVAWVDELEKGMAGAGSSGATDSGVTARVFGAFIQWMQDRERPVFIVATGNKVWTLPPELLRAGRFDEIFSVDLPTLNERKAILGIHLRKKGRDPKRFDVDAVAETSNLFSGAELEGVVAQAMFAAFADNGREITTDDLLIAARATVPLAVTRKEEIDMLREWASTRAKPASSASDLVTLDGGSAIDYTERRRRLMLSSAPVK